MEQESEIAISQEDAMLKIIQHRKEKVGYRGPFTAGQCDVCLSGIIDRYLWKEREVDVLEAQKQKKENWRWPVDKLSPVFMDAAWELCRMGVLRPGAARVDFSPKDKHSEEEGFSVTEFGKEWIERFSEDNFIPTDPGRFGELLEPFKDLFGLGFFERAQEAAHCFRTQCHLACCAMCGAATESIVLAAAVAKEGDEEKVVKEYSSSGGRGRVVKRLIGMANKPLQKEFRGFTNLLKYWRDEAAHGKKSGISHGQAFTSLTTLYLFAKLVSENWEQITGSKRP